MKFNFGGSLPPDRQVHYRPSYYELVKNISVSKLFNLKAFGEEKGIDEELLNFHIKNGDISNDILYCVRYAIRHLNGWKYGGYVVKKDSVGEFGSAMFSISYDRPKRKKLSLRSNHPAARRRLPFYSI